jgi:hypothetical protein
MTTTINLKRLAAEAEAILRGERLLSPEALVQRWGIKMRTLKKYWAQGHPGGFLLRVVWMGNRPRFRLLDVLEFEEKCAQRYQSRRQ